jgi:glycosyltransferase involved in cell wall biosynthesis
MNIDGLKVAIVHDWLMSMRGGEKVVESICELFPQSDIYTLVHKVGASSAKIESHPIYTSFIDRLPFKNSIYRHYLPLFPLAIEGFNLRGYDMIISSSHCVAKGIISSPDTLHISYIHTPMRYVWDMYYDYFGKESAGWLNRKIISVFANYLRMWDVTSSKRINWFIANSRHVANRIQKYYGREASIIHPPVDLELFQESKNPGDYYLLVSSLVPYKRVDLAIRTFNRIQKPLLILGEGPLYRKLHSMAGKTIKFIGWQPLSSLNEYYANCKALIFPGEEDFGIVPVEAQKCGKPVVAFAKGGALETVIGYSGQNEGSCSGVFFFEQNVQALEDALVTCENLEWNPSFISKHTQQFGKERFLKQLEKFINIKVEQFFGNRRLR